MSHTTSERPVRGLRGLAIQANPRYAVAAVAIPLLALAGALVSGDLRALTYVHVMAGVLWTGIDLFMGIVLGPLLGGLDPESRADFFKRFTPKMTFLMPTLAAVTITGGITLALRLGKFPNADPWLALLTVFVVVPAAALIMIQFDATRDPRWWTVIVLAMGYAGWTLATTGFAMTDPWIVAALAIVTVLSVQGFGILMPGEVKIYRQIVSDDPDVDLIGQIGMRNARLSGIQGLMQLAIIYVMVQIRF